jgi:hypothetical protein
MYLINAFSQGLKSVHVDDSCGDGDNDTQDSRTEAATAANFDLKTGKGRYDTHRKSEHALSGHCMF